MNYHVIVGDFIDIKSYIASILDCCLRLVHQKVPGANPNISCEKQICLFYWRRGHRESRNSIPTNGNSNAVVLIGAIIRKFQERFCYSGTGSRQCFFSIQKYMGAVLFG